VCSAISLQASIATAKDQVVATGLWPVRNIRAPEDAAQRRGYSAFSISGRDRPVRPYS